MCIRDSPQYSALSVYQDVNGGNKQGGSFAKIPNDKLAIGEKDLGTRTWLKPQAVKDGWQHGGGSTWGWWPYDARTNLVYYGTGNPSVWNPDVRPGDNKWSMTCLLYTSRMAPASGVTAHNKKNSPAAPQTALCCAALYTSTIIVLLNFGAKLPIMIASFTTA